MSHLTGLSALMLGYNYGHVGDRAIAPLLMLADLQKLYLTSIDVTDAGLVAIVKQFANLQVLAIGGTGITDNGLEALVELTHLRKLILNTAYGSRRSRFSVGAVQNLQQLLPNCVIEL